MAIRSWVYPALLAGLAAGAQAESVDWGVAAGGSFVGSKAVTAPFGRANTGLANGFAAALWGGHQYRWVGGEIRYLFAHQQLRVASGNARANFRGRTHAVHYTLMVHLRPAEAAARPFVAAGGGIRGYQGTGTESLYQPLQEYVLLTRTTQWKGLAVFGGGVKWRLGPRLEFRLEVYDYLTPFPEKVLAPAPGASVGGWIHNIVPTAGLGLRY